MVPALILRLSPRPQHSLCPALSSSRPSLPSPLSLGNMRAGLILSLAPSLSPTLAGPPTFGNAFAVPEAEPPAVYRGRGRVRGEGDVEGWLVTEGFSTVSVSLMSKAIGCHWVLGERNSKIELENNFTRHILQPGQTKKKKKRQLNILPYFI